MNNLLNVQFGAEVNALEINLWFVLCDLYCVLLQLRMTNTKLLKKLIILHLLDVTAPRSVSVKHTQNHQQLLLHLHITPTMLCMLSVASVNYTHFLKSSNDLACAINT